MNSIAADHIAQEDLLGRKKFAGQIVHSLAASFERIENSIVIGISGRWGSGKSTLLQFIESALQDTYGNDREKFIIIHFNPWENEKSEDLQRNFLETVIRQLEKVKWKNDIQDANNIFKKYLRYLNYIKFVKHVHPVAEKIVDAIDEYNKEVSASSLDDLKKQVNELITEKGVKLYIFIDDLDRLEPHDILGVFKTVKLNINFLNTVFFIAYDKDVVINALRNQFNNNAESYLEKIIQVDFNIPEILEEEIENMFFDRLKNCLQKMDLPYSDREVFKIWKYHGLREYFHTIRDLKRFFNSLIFSLPNIGKDINIPDFISLEAIKVFDFSSYETLYSNFLEIRRKSMWSEATIQSDIDANYKSSTTKSILNYLLLDNKRPRIEEPINEKRFRDIEFFQRYYSLYIPSRDIADEMLTKFLTAGSNKKQLLYDILDTGRVKNFLRRLSDPELKNHYNINDLSILSSLLDFFDQRENEITSNVAEHLWHSYFNLAHSYENKFHAAREAISNLFLNESAYQPMRFYFNHFIFAFKDNQRRDRQWYGAVDEQIELMLDELRTGFIKNMQKHWPSYFHKAAKNDNHYVTNLFIYSFAKYYQPDYKKALDRYMENSSFITFVIKHNFIMYEAGTEKPSRIMLGKKDLYFPGDFYNKLLKQLNEFKKGAVSEKDEEIILFFINEVRSE